ncbi:uncharacterized protein LOC134286828 [Aedes albopictus]|uniref:Peptidase A2 domain-containing protein n=1 Tax=Aedes albopictus TaxID=7160 RepID=A0ABM1YDL0_AEDAL
MRQREMKQEEELLEKALRKQQQHLDRMGRMRKSYQEKMSEVQEKLDTSGLRNKWLEKKQGFVGRMGSLSLQEQAGGSKGRRSEKKVKMPDPEDQEEEESEEEISEEESEDQSSSGEDEDCRSEESDGDTEKEVDEDENAIKKKHKKRISKKLVSHGLGRHSAGPTKAQLAARNGLSKKLPIFSGKPEEWPLFIGSYEASNEACGYNDVENLVRLQECLKGSALESVRGQLLLPKSVPKVIEKLRQLYGRPEQLLQFHLEKVNRLDSPKADRLETFIPFGNAVEQLCDHLEAADLKQHLINPLLLQNLLDKLPSPDKREWVRYKISKKKVNLRTFSDFLSRIVSEACEANACGTVQGNDGRTVKSGRGGMRKHGAVYVHSTSINPSGSTPLGNPPTGSVKPCRVCKRTDHRLRFCQDFKALSFRDRMKVVEKGKLCQVCLNDHGNAPCKFKIRCNVVECGERHHPLLHPFESRIVMNSHFHVQGAILFRMVPVTLHCGNRMVSTLAFLDEGASITLVERSLTDRLGAVGVHEPLTITWTADVTRDERSSTKMNLWVSGSDGKILLKAVQTVKQLLLPKQCVVATAMKAAYRYLRDVPFSSYSSQRPGMQIGLNNLHAITPMETKLGQPGEPIAVKSKLGWEVYGPKKNPQKGRNFVGYHHEVSNEELHNLLREQYALEESVVAVPQESKEENRAREIMEWTTVRVGDRYPMAVRRMKQLEQRLRKTPDLFDNVRMQIVEYQQKGYAHQATPQELARFDPSSSWFLPINFVLNPKKPGKVRLVWDAAATVDGVSLNSQLLTGPDLLTPLPSVIYRFRERPIGFGGDIKEMYHQLLIREVDKCVQLFLFRNSPDAPPSVYVMDVATFGSKCSPSQAHVDTVQEAVNRAKEVRFIHANGGFEIRNWVSNSGTFLDELGETKASQAVHFSCDKESGTERVLGIVT